MATPPVVDFKVSKTADKSIELSWEEPKELGEGIEPIDSYHLELSYTEDFIAEKLGDWTKAYQCGKIEPPKNKVNVIDLQYGATYRFRIATVNKAGKSDFVEVGPVICSETFADAKILVPRAYAAGKKIKIRNGEQIKLIIPFEGTPKPKITWTKDGEDFRLDDSGRPRVAIRNTKDTTCLFIRNSDRWDSGIYNLKVEVASKAVTADLDLAVIETPTEPRKIQCVEVCGASAQLKWLAPKDDGNCDILGYQVEKRNARSEEWYVTIEKCRHTGVQINDLILGNSYYFRVRAYNECGMGEMGVTKEMAAIVKDQMVYKKPVLPPLDFGKAPEFTLKMEDRKIMAGYNGGLTCALAGHPKPKLRWYKVEGAKKKVEIIDNPKYKTTFSQGIVRLEIRRARPGDAGLYELIATNNLGEAVVDAKITVKSLD